jgi:hypothetical protein
MDLYPVLRFPCHEKGVQRNNDIQNKHCDQQDMPPNQGNIFIAAGKCKYYRMEKIDEEMKDAKSKDRIAGDKKEIGILSCLIQKYDHISRPEQNGKRHKGKENNGAHKPNRTVIGTDKPPPGSIRKIKDQQRIKILPISETGRILLFISPFSHAIEIQDHMNDDRHKTEKSI